MRERCQFILSLGLLLVNSLLLPAYGQLGFDLKIDKPKPYEERVLRGEKSQEKPLRAPGRFFQNLTTHYNYFFNANTKLNEVIDAAKAAFRDDYTTLLPFYNYSLDATAQNSKELDSVIYKAQTGIVMHDLRNDWIDNLYLLWGAAWFMEKKFDSASLMFQFINHSFAEKEKDGYYKYIGSRMDGNNALTISTKENNKFPKNTVTPPSRNNAFIWQARAMIEAGKMAQAGSLIATLKNDPLFPKRLEEDLAEVQAYWFYKQGMWDSSAYHLLNALSQAKTKQEKARWEYLAAQMLERSEKPEEAQKWYSKSIAHTTDPVMDVYARLNIVRIQKDTTSNYIDRNINELLKMAKRDKYVDYRDVIYFMAAQMEMERNNFEAAQKLLLKSTKYNNDNIASKSRSYLLIADLSFDQKKYQQASAFYDSIQMADINEREAARVDERKELLKKFVAFSNTISRQDSLQRIAAMPEEDRVDYITRLVKQLRKQQGLDDAPTGGSSFPTTAPDLFGGSQPRGEWYFNNPTLKAQGNAKFKQVWGNRPNVDNWRRFSAVSQQLNNNALNQVKGATKTDESNQNADNAPTLESLTANLPFTEEQIRSSNDSIRLAMFGLGVTYLNELQDHKSAIEIFEQIRQRFPEAGNMDEILFNLYYAYRKAGNDAKAEEIKRLLINSYGDTRFAEILRTGKDPVASANSNEEATRAYEKVYDLFIEGRFEDALTAKKNADSAYRTTTWQPQLLYIEAVYHIKQRNDSLAKQSLQTLIGQNEDSVMVAKAQTMLDVLGRRHQIEAELTAMQIERPQDEVIEIPELQQPTRNINVQRDSMINMPRTAPRDTSSKALPKRDIAVNLPKPGVDSSAIVKKDTVKTILPPKKDTALAVITKPVADTPLVKKPPLSSQPKQHASGYWIDTMARHYVVVILQKVDPLFAVEVKNAFFRYGREKFPSIPFDYVIRDFDADNKLLVISGFQNGREAKDYTMRARPASATEIMPWLSASKYSFTIVAESNLERLVEKKDLAAYAQFLEQTLQWK